MASGRTKDGATGNINAYVPKHGWLLSVPPFGLVDKWVPAKKMARGKKPFHRADGRDSDAMTSHERMKTACDPQHLGITTLQACALSSNLNRSDYSNTVKVRQVRGRNTTDIPTIRRSHRHRRKHRQTSAPLAEPGFQSHHRSAPLRTENTSVFSVSANARFTNFATLLQLSRCSTGQSPVSVGALEQGCGLRNEPTVAVRYPNGTHDAACCVRMADLPTKLPRSGSFCNSVERKNPKPPPTSKPIFRNLVTTRKLHESVMMLQDQPTHEQVAIIDAERLGTPVSPST